MPFCCKGDIYLASLDLNCISSQGDVFTQLRIKDARGDIDCRKAVAAQEAGVYMAKLKPGHTFKKTCQLKKISISTDQPM